MATDETGEGPGGASAVPGRSTHAEADADVEQISALFAELRSADSDESQSARICSTLRSSITRSNLPTVRPDVTDAGGVSAVVSAMVRHPHNSTVQSKSCGILSSLAYDSKRGREAVRMEDGAMDAVVAAMRDHPSVGPVQAEACAVWANLTAGDGRGDRSSRTKAGNSGVIPLIVAALREHRSDASVVRSGCAALKHLAMDDANNCARIVEAGGAEAVLDALGGHLDDGTAAGRACGALATLSYGGDRSANRGRIAKRRGSVGLLVGAARRHPDSEPLVKSVLTVLRPLVAGWEGCAAALSDCGGIPAVSSAMAAYPDAETVQMHGCSILRTVASADDRRGRIVSAGGLDALVGAMVRHPTSREVQLQACAAVHNVCILGTANDATGEAGAVRPIVAALRQFGTDEELLEIACLALHRLSASGSNVRLIREEDPVNLLYNVAGRYPESCGRTARGVLKNT